MRLAQFLRRAISSQGSVPMLNRRTLLKGTVGFAVLGVSLDNALAKTAALGSINAAELGVEPDAPDDQSKAFATMLAEASQRNAPVFLPPGTYVVSNLTLPARVRLSGVPGASRILYGGNGHLLTAEQAEHIEFTALVFDGANGGLAERCARPARPAPRRPSRHRQLHDHRQRQAWAGAGACVGPRRALRDFGGCGRRHLLRRGRWPGDIR